MWGSIAWNGVREMDFIDGIMTKEVYMDILERKLRSSAKKLKLGKKWIFQQDGDPKHTAKIVKKWLQDKKIKVLNWVAQSPDLNPIEHIWSVVKKRIALRKPTNIADLRAIAEQEWNSIEPSVVRNLVESMPRRIQSVIDAKGGPTRY